MKIKILFFIRTLNGGGAEKVLRNLVNSMDHNKFDITVQTTFKEDSTSFLNKNVKYKYCYKNKNVVSKLIFRAQTATKIIYPLHVKDDYDIEVAYLEAESTKIMAGSTNKKAKKIAWVHCDLKRLTDNTKHLVKKLKPWYDTYNRVICVSENVRNAFVELFGNTPKAEVIYNTIDSEDILKKSTEPLPKNITKTKLTLVIVGRLTAQKNYPRLLKTAKKLLEEGFDFDLWILGEGEDRNSLEKYITENNLTDNVRLFGFCNNPYPFIKTADLLVCSSNYEGFSTFVTEGLILGKTVVTTDCSGMDELLGESEYGIITENNDEAFTDGLRKMLSNPQLLDEYTKKAQTRGQQFSKEQLIAQTENLFYNTLGIK